MTIYFKEYDWGKLKDVLHQCQKLTDEGSDLGTLIDEALEILENQDRDEAMEEMREEKAIAEKRKQKK